MRRDPGLQPERTSMSWLRTQLLMFGTGALMFKVGMLSGSVTSQIFGVILLIFAVLYSYYIRKRFTQRFNDNTAVTLSEFHIKRLTSLLIGCAALAYFSSLVYQAVVAR